MLIQELVNTKAFFWLLFQALIDEVLESWAPSLRKPGRWLVNDCLKKFIALLDVGEGRLTSSQLKGKATKGPHIDFL